MHASTMKLYCPYNLSPKWDWKILPDGSEVYIDHITKRTNWNKICPSRPRGRVCGHSTMRALVGLSEI